MPRSLRLVSASFVFAVSAPAASRVVMTAAACALVCLAATPLWSAPASPRSTASAHIAKVGSPVPVTIHRAVSSTPTVSFNNDVEPLLTRLGCNQGACHGAQYGKGGFKLSLAAFDPDLDFANTVRQARARRISVADPAHSLFLLKPLMAVPHGGGRRLETNTPAYTTLLRWLQQGAPGPNPADPIVTLINITPAERVLPMHSRPQQLTVRATFSDKSIRDVTADTRLNTLNDGIAGCTPDGLVTPIGRGQTAIMARYGGQATVATVLVPFGEAENRRGLEEKRLRGEKTAARQVMAAKTSQGQQAAAKAGATSVSEAIDALVSGKQRQLGLTASPLCDDRAFIRRASFDLIGTAPTGEEIGAFLADTRPDKRARLIDALLDRPEYADYWTLKWGDLLRSNRQTLGVKGMWSFTAWIRAQMGQNRPADQFVHDLITAQGSTFTNGPANFYRVVSNPQDLAETTSQVFLGVRMQCARCHHHPFEKWSQADYYRFAAFFARVGLKQSTEFGLFGNEQIVRINDGGEVYHPKTGAKMRPTPPGVQLTVFAGKMAPPDVDADGDRRTALADWLTAPANRLFSRNLANRYWGYLFSKGLVNPIDDMRVTNPPTNSTLLDLLADELTRSHYDLKHLLKIICTTQTYGRSSAAMPGSVKDELFFTHYLPRRLGSETLLDAIDSACGTHEKFPQLPPGTRAIALPDPNVGSDFLDTFGRPARVISCECERSSEPNLSQTLRLMNGYTVNNKVAEGGGRIAKLIAAHKSSDAILTDIYLAALGHPPSYAERIQVMGALAFAPDARPIFEDVLLTLLNSKEFLFNH